MSDRYLTTLVVVVAAYVAAQIFADVASLRIASVWGFTVDAGTLVYPFTFTLRDLVHKLAGIHLARRLIATTAVLNLAMAGVFLLAAQLPADPSGGQQSDLFPDVLSPVWRIVVASVVAEVVAELVDSEAYRLWVDRVGERFQWGRVLVSNAVSVPLDSAIFVTVAFAGVLPGPVVVELFWVNVAFKGVVTLFSMPWIYLVHPRSSYQDAPAPSRA